MALWLDQASAKHPDRAAVEHEARSISYSELAALSRAGAGSLAAAGRRRGEPVPLATADRLEFAIALHSCLRHGGVAVPIDPRLAPPERTAREVTRVASLGGAVATVMFTSGTTAASRPVELTYANWEANAVGSALALGLDPAERWLCAMPLAHVGGLSILIRSVIYATTVVLHDRFETQAVLDELMRHDRRITLVSLVPTMLARLLDAGLRAPPSLRWALVGGGPIPPALLARAATASVPVAPTYGMTETCSQVVTFGFPLHGAELQTSGSDGEILVRGPMVSPGALGADGWLATGDLGRIDNGRLVVVGRLADTIISGGENVAPAEVEAVLLAHPAVADAAVFGRPDPTWGEAVVARVIARDGVTPHLDRLRSFCRERLAGFKVPSQIEFVDALPRSESGKLLRRELR